MSIEQTVARFIEIPTLTHRPASLPSSLGTYQPQLECLDQLSINEAWKGKFSRDDDDLCIQPQPGNTENPKDGGDSAHRAGYLAFCGSQLDQANLARFMLESGLMVRHPKQAPWNNPWNATRDQLIARPCKSPSPQPHRAFHARFPLPNLPLSLPIPLDSWKIPRP